MSSSNKAVIFSTDDYLIPQLAGLPQFKFFFEVIKEGSIIGNLPIRHKQFSLIGRLEDLSDIFIDNPTVSRKHAILQFYSTDLLPSLYDLGSAQGTFVNKQKLPAKAYKKLQLFANVKFGASSRYYVLRCPQLQQKFNQEAEIKENQFIKTIAHQNQIISKQDLKNKYIQLLENDPYFGGQLKSRKFQGYQPEKRENNKHYQGITWGIGDENQVYAFRNEKEFPIQPDVLRRLPGLNETMFEKISQYQQKFRIYDQIETQLNEITNREKRQFGLEQKLQNKKEKLQKKFVESLQALEKCEEWIRINIFGVQNSYENYKNKKKQKEADTFSDDQFYDRTLQDKKLCKEDKPDINKKQQKPINQSTVQDLWMLKKSFVSFLSQKKQLINVCDDVKFNNNLTETMRSQDINQQEKGSQQEDELQLFMKENQQGLKQENQVIYQRQIDIVQKKLKELKGKLLNFLSVKQVSRLEDEVLNPEKLRQTQEKKQKKQSQEKLKLQQTLQKLQAQQNIRKQKLLKQKLLQNHCQDEYSLNIFDLYRQQNSQQSSQQLNSQQNLPNRPRIDIHNQNQSQKYSEQHIKGYKKLHYNQTYQQQEQQKNSNIQHNHSAFQEQVIDLTSSQEKFIYLTKKL